MDLRGPLRVGVGGPVGSGKTALVERLCKKMRGEYDIAVVTNDIYTKEDAEFLTRAGALEPERIVGVETGGCPHTAIREDASINLAAVSDIVRKWPKLEIVFVESGGDNLAATFSPELADLTIYVIDVAAGEKIPRKGGPGITRSDLLVINKIDLAPLVGANLDVMDRDARRMRGVRPFLFSNLKENKGVDDIAAFIVRQGGLPARPGRSERGVLEDASNDLAKRVAARGRRPGPGPSRPRGLGLPASLQRPGSSPGHGRRRPVGRPSGRPQAGDRGRGAGRLPGDDGDRGSCRFCRHKIASC